MIYNSPYIDQTKTTLDLKSTSETSLASQWASHPFSTANFAGTQWCPPSNKYVRTYREQWRQFEVLLSIFAEERRGFQLNDRRTQDCISDCSSLSLYAIATALYMYFTLMWMSRLHWLWDEWFFVFLSFSSFAKLFSRICFNFWKASLLFSILSLDSFSNYLV